MFGLIISLAVLTTVALYAYGLYLSLKRHRFAIFAIVAVSPYVAYKLFQFSWYARVIPSKIEIAYPVTAGDEFGFREGCGIAVYKISDSTLRAIDREGLRFFDNAKHGRGYPKPSEPLSVPEGVRALEKYHYHTYESWKETPVPVEWTSEGTWIMCDVGSDRVVHELTLAAKRSGAYYTTSPEAQLVVIPALGYVVFSYYG